MKRVLNEPVMRKCVSLPSCDGPVAIFLLSAVKSRASVEGVISENVLFMAEVSTRKFLYIHRYVD
jgi:hypothetical protein